MYDFIFSYRKKTLNYFQESVSFGFIFRIFKTKPPLEELRTDNLSNSMKVFFNNDTSNLEMI